VADDVTLLTEEEIAQLPRWAKVAFAARCARRVLPLYQKSWPEAPEKYVDVLWSTVESAELSASIATASAKEEETAVVAKATGSAAASPPAFFVATAAHLAALAASATDNEAKDTALAAGMASMANAATAIKAIRWAVPITRYDFQQVLNESQKGNWTDDTPVPPWVFGPMWPNGVPEDWPEADPQERLQVTVGVPEDAKPEQTADYLNRLHELLNKLNIQNGGVGITIDTVRREQPKAAPVPVGGRS
jgi:hypothetical protein